MHLFYIPQCTIQNVNIDIAILNGTLWDIEQVHCGICESGQFNVFSLVIDVFTSASEWGQHWLR